MEQIERIQEMEDCLDASEKAISELSEALTAYQTVQTKLSRVGAKHSRHLWMQDFEDDEAGKIPRDLKRGVLSEDAVYDLLTENRELLVRMLRLVTGALESDGL